MFDNLYFVQQIQIFCHNFLLLIFLDNSNCKIEILMTLGSSSNFGLIEYKVALIKPQGYFIDFNNKLFILRLLTYYDLAIFRNSRNIYFFDVYFACSRIFILVLILRKTALLQCAYFYTKIRALNVLQQRGRWGGCDRIWSLTICLCRTLHKRFHRSSFGMIHRYEQHKTVKKRLRNCHQCRKLPSTIFFRQYLALGYFRII